MTDVAHNETDKLIEKLEKKIKKEYAQAEKEAEAKLKKHLDGFAQRDKDKKKLVDAGQMTQEAYDKWRQQQILTGERWQAMVNTLADDMANASKIAEGMTKGYMADAYALNHNYATYEVEHASKINTSYALYDKSTVERLVKENPKILPKMNPAGKTAQDIRDGKIKRWNKQKITSALTQGILQGESIDKLSRRMRSVAEMDYKASIRNARTAMTGAQNAGRLDGYERANDMGIETQKQWLAVMDDRTRHEHRMLDGQRVDVDDPFEVDGYEIMYPGDPAGEPEMVYNCRCTMICAIKGFEKDFTDRKNDALGDMTYDEWKGIHESAEPEADEKEEIHTNAQDDYRDLIKWMTDSNVKHLDVEKLEKPLSNDEIVNKLSGGDNTRGSCASLCFAYTGNKMGLDVTDFRGGNSQLLFSQNFNVESMVKISNADLHIVEVKKEAKGAADILINLPKDQEFMVWTGRHASIIRNTEKGVEYLEMQSPFASENGWNILGETKKDVEWGLQDRFGSRSTVPGKVHYASVESFQPTEEYKEALGYLNTQTDLQKKGARGGIK